MVFELLCSLCLIIIRVLCGLLVVVCLLFVVCCSLIIVRCLLLCGLLSFKVGCCLWLVRGMWCVV